MLASNLLRTSVIMILVGLVAGIGMGVTEDFRLAPAHAHLNLIGFVALFLAGLYYAAVPEAATTALARVQAWTAVIGAIVFPVGIGLVVMEGPQFELVAIVGSIVVLIAMALFAWIVFSFGIPAATRGP